MWRAVTIACLAFAAGVAGGFLLHRSGALSQSATAAIDPWASPAYRMRYGVLSTFPEHADVVMAGDSLTEVMDWRAAFPELKIVNHGISADTTVGLLGRLDLIERTGAKTVAMMIGVNDLQRGEPVEQVFARTMRTVDRLKGRCVIVQSVLPTRRGDDLNKKIGELNSHLEKGCTQNRCVYANIGGAVAPNGGFSEEDTVDGLHLSGTSYMKWRDALKPYLARCSN